MPSAVASDQPRMLSREEVAHILDALARLGFDVDAPDTTLNDWTIEELALLVNIPKASAS